MLPPQVPFDCQVPFRHTSCPRCAWPTQENAPFLSHATPKAPSAVPSMTMPPPLPPLPADAPPLLCVPPLPAVLSAPELPPAPASPWTPGLCTHALFTQLWSDRQSASEVHAVRPEGVLASGCPAGHWSSRGARRSRGRGPRKPCLGLSLQTTAESWQSLSAARTACCQVSGTGRICWSGQVRGEQGTRRPRLSAARGATGTAESTDLVGRACSDQAVTSGDQPALSQSVTI